MIFKLQQVNPLRITLLWVCIGSINSPTRYPSGATLTSTLSSQGGQIDGNGVYSGGFSVLGIPHFMDANRLNISQDGKSYHCVYQVN